MVVFEGGKCDIDSVLCKRKVKVVQVKDIIRLFVHCFLDDV